MNWWRQHFLQVSKKPITVFNFEDATHHFEIEKPGVNFNNYHCLFYRQQIDRDSYGRYSVLIGEEHQQITPNVHTKSNETFVNALKETKWA